MTDQPLVQLSRLNIVVVAEINAESQTLTRHLQRSRAAVRHIWPAPEQIGENADIVLCDYGPGLGRRLAWMPGDPSAALIILMPQNGRFDLKEIRAACPDSVLYRPYQPYAIDTAILMALDHFSFGKRMKARIVRMEENIRAMRDIEKAKHAIMMRENIGEAEAFRLLREKAMQRRVSIASYASKLVDSIDNLI